MNFKELLTKPPVGQHKELNPDLWEPNQRLKSEVRGALMRIAEDFTRFLEVPIDLIDLVITGGNANYTYTQASDIDLHLVIDYEQVPCDREVHELMDAKRILYKKTTNITVHKIPVELYVEDVRTPAVSRGCYSILRDQWLREPSHAEPYDQGAVAKAVSMWHTIIQYAKTKGELGPARTTMALLKQYRQMGLATRDGEFSIIYEAPLALILPLPRGSNFQSRR
jgi:hypothetical protein